MRPPGVAGFSYDVCERDVVETLKAWGVLRSGIQAQ